MQFPRSICKSILKSTALASLGLVLFLAIQPKASASEQCPNPVYAFTNTNAFGTLCLSSGVLGGTFTQLGSGPFAGYTGLGDFAGNLYIDGQYFWQVNPANGSVTGIGQGAVNCRELGSTPSGVMYCLDNSNNKILYSVNPTNGALSAIGSGTNLPIGGGGTIALSTDDPQLYVTQISGSGSVLYLLNTSSGLAGEIAPVTFDGTPVYIQSMVYAEGQLYATSNNVPTQICASNDGIYTLSVTSGNASFVTCTSVWVYGMAAGPVSTFTYKQPYAFTGGYDGATPLAGVTIDRAGNLYGTAYAGGVGYGTAYKLTPQTNGIWAFKTLYPFAGGNDGAGPAARLIFGTNGSLYSTTFHGGDGTGDCTVGYTGCGTVYNLTPPLTPCKTARCPWTETLLYQFQGGTDGLFPYQADLLFDRSGNIYGTTLYGGLYGDGTCAERWNCGTVYELKHMGNSWTEILLHSFNGNPDGAEPYSGVIFDSAGNLYGTTYRGPNGGTVYQLTPLGGGWTESPLLFSGCCDISAGLIFDSAGNLYGAAGSGGGWDGGFAFRLTSPGWTLADLYDFDDDNRGAGPNSTLVMDSAGNLYGTTAGLGSDYGTVFKLTPYNGSYIQTVMYRFTDGSDGAYPYGPLVFDTSGNLYGTASAGGNLSDCSGAGCGVVFEITPN